MGVRAVVTIISGDGTSRMFWAGWASPEFQIPHVADWVSWADEQQLTLSVDTWRRYAAEHPGSLPAEEVTDTGIADDRYAGDLEYRYQLWLDEEANGLTLLVHHKVRQPGEDARWEPVARLTRANLYTQAASMCEAVARNAQRYTDTHGGTPLPGGDPRQWQDRAAAFRRRHATQDDTRSGGTTASGAGHPTGTTGAAGHTTTSDSSTGGSGGGRAGGGPPQGDGQRQARAGLAYLFGPGRQLAHLVGTAGGPVAAYQRLRQRGEQPDGLRGELAGLSAGQLWQVADHLTETVAAAGGRVVVPGDPDWPSRLPDLATTDTVAGDADVPAVLCLFVRGTAPEGGLLDRAVTITGARAATAYGAEVARQLGYGCAEHDWTVVSGGGYGCDGYAHRGALAAGGTTIAVLPGGLDRPYPAGHQPLFDTIVDHGGLLVSMYPPGIPPVRPQRAATGRLLATVTAGTVVVEAPRRSHSLQTLAQAATLGRPAMVVPGPVTSALSAGGHEALRNDPRLRLVTSPAEVLAELHTAPATTEGT